MRTLAGPSSAVQWVLSGGPYTTASQVRQCPLVQRRPRVGCLPASPSSSSRATRLFRLSRAFATSVSNRCGSPTEMAGLSSASRIPWMSFSRSLCSENDMIPFKDSTTRPRTSVGIGPPPKQDDGPRRLERSSRASRRVSSRIRLAGASAVAVALDVGLYLSNIGDISSVSLFRGAASIENVFAPYKGRDRNSDHENQGESNG